MLSTAYSNVVLLYSKGSVMNKKNKILKKGAILSVGDTISTGKNSLAIIKIDNQATLKLIDNSSVVIEKVQKSKKSSTDIFLKAGSLFSKVLKKYDGNEHYKVRTKNIVMGVRGTEFFASHGMAMDHKHGDQKNMSDFWMCVNEGIVKIKSKKNEYSVKEGEGVFVKMGTNVTTPKEYAWTKKLNWNTDPENGKLDSSDALKELYKDVLDADYD